MTKKKPIWKKSIEETIKTLDLRYIILQKKKKGKKLSKIEKDFLKIWNL